jgi:hypothetical protein
MNMGTPTRGRIKGINMTKQQDRDPDAAFIGWHRPDRRSRWQPVVTGPTEYETLGRLLEVRRDGDLTVLSAGKDPNQDSMLR